MNEQDFTEKLLESEQMLYRIACSLLRSEDDRQDALQETALKAWQNIGRLREEKYFRTWITRILVNECHNLHRKAGREIPTETLPEMPAPQQDDPAFRMLLACRKSSGCRSCYITWKAFLSGKSPRCSGFRSAW